MDSGDDNDLMSAYGRGNEAAFKQLYSRHRSGLYRYIKRLLGSAMERHVDEVFQDTWMRVIQARDRWSSQGAQFRTWLYTLAHNCVIDRLRKSGREVSLDAFEDDQGEPWEPEVQAWASWPVPEAPAGEDVAFWRRAGEKLLSCLDSLPLPQRAAFLMHHDDGLPLEEIAKALSIGFEAAKSRLRYGISKLRTCMGAYLKPAP
jgi:RNA polymerase sigma factor (sigma-70 family)